jgi:fructoselysine 3-epimerase
MSFGRGKMNRISFSSFLYLNYPLTEAILRISQAGYNGIDIWGGRPHAYRRDLGQSEIEELKGLLKSLNLGIASFIPAQFRYPTCLCSDNEVIRQDSVAYIQDSIRTASALGAPIVSVCPGHSLFGQAKVDAWRSLRTSLDDICLFAMPYNIKIAIEPADRYETDLIQTVADALRMINEIDRDNLGVVLDTGHAHVVGESAVDALAAAQDRLFHIHIDDNLGLRDQHLVPGQGSFDFTAFFKALEKSGYQGYLGVELGWDYTLDPNSAAFQTLRYIHSLNVKY